MKNTPYLPEDINLRQTEDDKLRMNWCAECSVAYPSVLPGKHPAIYLTGYNLSIGGDCVK